jgi:uncharacterized membrane protein
MAPRTWPIRLRAMSFAITVAVVALEAALIAIPGAVIAWLLGIAAVRAFEFALAISIGWALAIAVYSHISPVGLPRRVFSGGQR